MNRTLKRPMFRKGGIPNEGIMSGLTEPRQKYAEGDSVTYNKSPQRQQIINQVMVEFPNAPLDTQLEIVNQRLNEKQFSGVERFLGADKEFNPDRSREEAKDYLYDYSSLGKAGKSILDETMGGFSDLAGNYVANPLINTAEFITGLDIADTPVYNYKKGRIDAYSKTKRDEKGNIISTNKSTEDALNEARKNMEAGPEGGAGLEGGAGPEGELQESDLKTVYADLLPMFKEALGTDDDELNRQKYLELARFGTNLLAQPGGDLTGAVGKAAAPSVEGLARIADAQRQAAKLPAKYALEAALKEVEPGQIAKSVKDLESLGYSRKDALRKIVDEGTGSATREATLSREIESDAAALLSGDIVKNEFEGRKLAKQLFKEGIGIEEISKLPEDKDDFIEGGIYIDKGIIKKYKKGKLYKRGEKGFK